MRIPGFQGARLEVVGKRVWKELGRDAVSDGAGLLGYYVLFAIFPFLFFLITLAAYLPIRRPIQDALQRLHALMPGQAFDVLHGLIHQLVTHRQPHLLTITLVSAIWSASRAVDAFRKSMNLAYDVRESRPAWKTNALAIGLTFACSAAALISLAMIAVGGNLGAWLASHIGVGREWQLVWSWLRWPSTALVVMLSVAIAFYALPDVEQRFKFITPGSLVGTLLWLVATWGFSLYADHFSNYNATYGSLGGIILLNSWVYFSALVFIAGAEWRDHVLLGPDHWTVSLARYSALTQAR